MNKYFSWFALFVLITLVWVQHDANVAAAAKLAQIESTLQVAKLQNDTLYNNVMTFKSNVDIIIRKLSLQIDTLSAKAGKVVQSTRTKVDSFRVELPDTLKKQFESIISGYEHALELKNTEIELYKQKELAYISVDSLSFRLNIALKRQSDAYAVALHDAIKALRPNLVHRLLNKAPELGAIALIIFLKK